jgi:hypothetical protein
MIIKAGIIAPVADIDSMTVTLIVSCASIKIGRSTARKVHTIIPFVRYPIWKPVSSMFQRPS